MKKLIYSLLCICLVLLNSCSNFTDLQPKGKNLLATVDQLDLLFNTVLDNRGFYSYDDEEFIGDAYPTLTNIPNLISQPSPSLQQILFTWDEKADRSQYTPSDYKYAVYYDIIGKIANPVLAKIDEAEGDAAKAKQLKAEALVLRAYFGYLSVNHFAKAYSPSTAATDGGVPYPLESDPISEPCKKYMVKEVYDMINADLDAALALNSLPDENVNQMRVSKAFAYAVKAKVCMSMREYDKAMNAAQQSLAVNNTIADYNTMLVNKKSRFGQAYKQFNRPYMKCNEDLFFTYSLLLYSAFTPEYSAMFEKGNVVYNYYPCDARAFGMRFAGPAYYGLDIDCWSYAIDTFISNSGLTSIDMYLTEAEIDIRNNKIDDAMTILDKIRICRVIPEDYQPLKGNVTTQAAAIEVFKKISRTESVWTVKNYINIKRWNAENNEWTETEKKTVVGKEYTLSPNSPLWIWAFPANATSVNSNLTQNY
jgi:tetratricopeptide (TPR) repeat protein